MVKRIDLFLPPRSQYGVLHHFTNEMCNALKSCGVNCRILEAEYNNPGPFLEALVQDPPDCTLSFNGLLPDEKGRFFCEMIGIPHVACIVDSQNLFIPLIHSPLTVIVCSDRFSCEFFRGLKCENVLFMPHGVEKSLCEPSHLDRCYDVTVLCSLIDYERLRDEWKEKYDKVVCKAMDDAIEKTLSDPTTTYVQALVEAVDRQMELNYHLDPSKVDFISVMDDVEMYLKGKSRIDIIKAVKDAKVHIFGSAPDSTSWEHYLGDHMKNIEVHEPVPYEQVIEILKQTKILLNASPWIKNGAHERIFYGLACGALVFTNENTYFNENFKNGENIVLYKNGDLKDVNKKVNEYLSNENLRQKIATKGNETVKANHSWEARAETLIKELEPILLKLREVIANRISKESS
ncbi:MAG: glycosyltransferase [Chlamydiota bacterium]|nr:glycosyltransferase [Chlamydiota bacterium]